MPSSEKYQNESHRPRCIQLQVFVIASLVFQKRRKNRSNASSSCLYSLLNHGLTVNDVAVDVLKLHLLLLCDGLLRYYFRETL